MWDFMGNQRHGVLFVEKTNKRGIRMFNIICASFVIIIAIYFSLIILLEMIYHMPKKNLTENDKKIVRSYGLCHITDEENVESILEKGLDSAKSKEMSKAEKRMVWCYIAEPYKLKEKADIVRSKGKDRSDRNKIVIFKNISEEQINKLRIRRAPKWVCCLLRPYGIQYDDEAICYKGDFDTPLKDVLDYYDLEI